METAKTANPGAGKDALIDAAIRANVEKSMEDLDAHSPALREAAKAGKVKVVGAVYHIEDGSIEWLGPHPNEGVLLANPANVGHNTSRASGPVAAADKLSERLQKITLVNEVIELGNAARIAVWKGQAMRDTKVAQDAMENSP